MVATAHPLKILVVDDKQVIHDFFDITLGYYGHHITVVRDPSEATEIVQQKEFDIAFLDMVMPEKNGVEVLKKLKAVRPHLPVVMMSGYSIQEQKDEAVHLGACGCLKKPFEVEDIKRIIKVAIGREI